MNYPDSKNANKTAFALEYSIKLAGGSNWNATHKQNLNGVRWIFEDEILQCNDINFSRSKTRLRGPEMAPPYYKIHGKTF